MISLSSLASQTACFSSWALKIFMYRLHDGILGTSGPGFSGAERLVIGQVLEQAPSEPIPWHHLHRSKARTIREGDGTGQGCADRGRTPSEHGIAQPGTKVTNEMHGKTPAHTPVISWCWCSISGGQALTVSSGWYQDRRAFFLPLPSSTTKVFWITLLLAALHSWQGSATMYVH